MALTRGNAKGLTPEKRLRLENARRLNEYMERRGVTPKGLQLALKTDYQIEVSAQAVNYWLNGIWAPSERNRQAVAAILDADSSWIFMPPSLPVREAA